MSTQEIWSSYRSNLLRYVMNHVRDTELSKDIVQDVFIKADQHKHEVRDNAKMKSWLFMLTRNLVIDHFRKIRKQRSIPVTDPGADESVTTYNDCVANCLQELIHTLPDRYKQILIDSDINGIPQHVLAERFSITYSGAKSRVQRGRKMLREKLMSKYRIEADNYGNIIVCENREVCKCSSDVLG